MRQRKKIYARLPMTLSTAAVLVLACTTFAQQPKATGKVSGKVVDHLGKPLVAAEVWCSRWPHTQRLAKGRTDGDGFFVLSKIPFGKNSVKVQATADGFSIERDYATVSSGRPHGRAHLRLWHAASIRGRVLDADQGPLANITVSATNDRARVFGFEPQGEAVTDAKGRFALPKVPLGEIHIRGWAPGYVLGEQSFWHGKARDGVSLVMRKGKGVTLDIAVESAPKNIPGRVRILSYESGGFTYIPGALSGHLDAAGRFSVSGLPDYQYRVSIYIDDHSMQPRTIRVKPGKKLHTLRFKAIADSANVIRGVLTDQQKKPLAGQRLQCRASNGGRHVNATTDAKGRFALRSPLAPGTKAVIYLVDSNYVTAQDPEGHRGYFDARDLNWHQFVVDPKAEVEIVAQRKSIVSGVVQDAKGRPISLQRVTLQHSRDGGVPRWMAFQYATTDRQGRFRFAKLRPPEGEIRVTVGTESAGQSSEPFTIGVGQERAGIKLIATRPGRTILQGVVRDENGKPVPGARVWLRDWDFATNRQASGSVIETLAGRDGRYCFPNVDPGGHWLQVYLRNRRQALRTPPFEVAAGKTVTKDLNVDGVREK